MKKILKIAGIVIASLLVVVILFAKANHISPIGFNLHNTFNQDSDGIALSGNDLISYYTSDKPVQGNSKFQAEWKDAKWNFSSEENKQLFIANPKAYLPQFGGYCSFAVSTGFTADCGNDLYTLVNNKLYLFSAPETQTDFFADSTKMQAANKIWQ